MVRHRSNVAVCPVLETADCEPDCNNLRVTHLLLAVLPFALGAAVSPTLLTLELLILTGRTQPKARAWMFALGASVTIFIIGLAAMTVMRTLTMPAANSTDPWLVWAKAAVSLILVALGIRELLPARTVGERHHSRIQQILEDAKTPVFLGVGVVAMLTNASTIVLYLPAVHLIVHAPDADSTKLLAGLMLWIITILPIFLPVLAVSIGGGRSDALLTRVNAWTTRETRPINAGLCFFFAALVAYSAIQPYL